MRERVLAIFNILARYVMEERDFMSESELVEELLSVGFEAEEIDAAFSWMENLSLNPQDPPRFLEVPSQRIFTPEEIRAIDAEARGFLVKLRTLGIIDDEVQEEIIDKALQMAEEEVTLQEMKSVTALTLFARSHDEWRREVECMMSDDWRQLYH